MNFGPSKALSLELSSSHIPWLLSHPFTPKSVIRFLAKLGCRYIDYIISLLCVPERGGTLTFRPFIFTMNSKRNLITLLFIATPKQNIAKATFGDIQKAIFLFKKVMNPNKIFKIQAKTRSDSWLLLNEKISICSLIKSKILILSSSLMKIMDLLQINLNLI